MPKLKRFLRQIAARLRRNSVREIASNTSWMLGERVGRALLSALVTALVARYLGPSQYATMAYAMVIVTFLTPLAQVGLNGVFVRRFLVEPEDLSAILGTGMFVRAIAGGLAFVIAAIVLLLVETTAESLLVGLLVAAQLPLQAVHAIDYWFQSRLESKYGARVRLALSVVINLVKVALVVAEFPLWTFAFLVSLEIGMISFALLITYYRHPMMVGLKYSYKLAADMCREGMPFMLSAFTIVIYMRVDQIFVKYFIGAEALGRYAAVLPFSQTWQILSVSVVASLTPYVTRKAAEGEDAYYAALRNLFLVTGCANLAIALVMWVSAPFLVRLLLGPAYVDAIPALQIHSFTNVFVGLGLAWNVWATNSGHGRLLLLNTFSGGVVAIVANAVLIPRLGTTGAAIAANLSFATSSTLVNFFTCRRVFFLQLGINKKAPFHE